MFVEYQKTIKIFHFNFNIKCIKRISYTIFRSMKKLKILKYKWLKLKFKQDEIVYNLEKYKFVKR